MLHCSYAPQNIKRHKKQNAFFVISGVNFWLGSQGLSQPLRPSLWESPLSYMSDVLPPPRLFRPSSHLGKATKISHIKRGLKTLKRLDCLTNITTFKTKTTSKTGITNNGSHTCYDDVSHPKPPQPVFPQHNKKMFRVDKNACVNGSKGLRLAALTPQEIALAMLPSLPFGREGSSSTPLKRTHSDLYNSLPQGKERSMTLKQLNAAGSSKITYNLDTFQRSNQDTLILQKPAVKEGDWVEMGDLLADSASSVGGELAIGHNIIIAYMPWEGYNYEDAILINERLVYEDIYTSIHIERYEITTSETNLGAEYITREIPDTNENDTSHLDKNGIAKIGTPLEEGDILVGKVAPFDVKTITPQQKLLYKIFDIKASTTKDKSFRAPKGIRCTVISVNIIARQKPETSLGTLSKKGPKTTKSSKRKEKTSRQTNKRIRSSHQSAEKLPPITTVHVYLAEKRKMQVGDKMAGRHGNKGIVSCILPRQDMPFLPDGTPVDIVLNPLGVPSRMNVGQIYECLLGLAGRYLGEHYKIPPFDEMYGADASRSFVLSKLYEARKKTGLKWLLDPNNPGKIRIFDGRNSECFDQTVTVGIAYVLKLVHMVDDKLHARSTGPYSLITQQPLRGRSKQGGQRLGEMEVWSIEGYGAAFVLSEMLTLKSDDITGRQNLWKNLISQNEISLGTPESFKVLVCELQALCLDIGLFNPN